VGPDGGTIGPFNQIIGTNILSYNGISGIKATQYGFLAGVFVNSQAPVAGTEPPVLDFTSIGTSFTQLAPVLNQSFYIGDGQTSSGTVQQFDVPAGATRLFLGFEDAYNVGWPSGTDPGYYYDNTGSFTADLAVVPEPSSFTLMTLPALICLFAWSARRWSARLIAS
jgi:PEP-CTERM motif